MAPAEPAGDAMGATEIIFDTSLSSRRCIYACVAEAKKVSPRNPVPGVELACLSKGSTSYTSSPAV